MEVNLPQIESGFLNFSIKFYFKESREILVNGKNREIILNIKNKFIEFGGNLDTQFIIEMDIDNNFVSLPSS
jgi:hypothetical protein